MQKLIDTSTAFYGAGNAPTHKLFTVNSGAYIGRQVVVYSAAPSTIKFSFADAPYTSWSTPQTLASNAADYPVAAVMDADGNVYVVYTAQTTLDLLFRKLTFGAGVWSVGSEVTIYNDKDNYFPTILKDVFDKLIVCWTCYDSSTGNYVIRSKQSANDGSLWGGGPSDAGSALTSGSTGCYSQLAYVQPYIYCFYTDAGSKLAYRRIPDGGVFWESETLLYTGSSLSDALSAAVSEAGSIIGVAFTGSGKLWYLEYDLQTGVATTKSPRVRRRRHCCYTAAPRHMSFTVLWLGPARRSSSTVARPESVSQRRLRLVPSWRGLSMSCSTTPTALPISST